MRSEAGPDHHIRDIRCMQVTHFSWVGGVVVKLLHTTRPRVSNTNDPKK